MIKINLNKKQKKVNFNLAKVDKKSLLYYFIAPVIISAVIIFFMQTAIKSKINDDSKNIVSYNQKISFMLPKIRMINAIKKKQSVIIQKINVIKELKRKQMGPVGFMFYVQEAIPRFAWIDSLKSNKGIISLTGIALDGQVVSLFMNNLDKTGFFNNVSLIQTSEVKKQGLDLQNFSLTFGINKRAADK